MATDLFREVREAEDRAEALVTLAQREARELVKEAQAACAENERAMAREHRALYQSIIEEKRKAMRQVLDEQAQSQREDIASQMNQARARLPQAAALIAERVMSDGNR